MRPEGGSPFESVALIARLSDGSGEGAGTATRRWSSTFPLLEQKLVSVDAAWNLHGVERLTAPGSDARLFERCSSGKGVRRCQRW